MVTGKESKKITPVTAQEDNWVPKERCTYNYSVSLNHPRTSRCKVKSINIY